LVAGSGDESSRDGGVVPAENKTDHNATMWEIAKRSVSAWIDDYAPSMGAALAYYALFSLAPLLLLAIAVAGLVFGADAARGEVVAQLGGLLGNAGASAIEGLLKSASRPAQSVTASIIGVVTLIVGASSTFVELQSDIDRVWHAPVAAKPSGIWGLLRARLLSFGLVVSTGFLLLVSLVVSAGLAAFAKWYGAIFPCWVITMQIVNQIVSLAFITTLFALMYRVLPSVRVAWRDIWRGAFATAILFTIGKFLIGLYLGTAGVASGFGAAGSIVVLLVWMYYSAQIFLLGAEFTWVYAHSRGSRASQTSERSQQSMEERAADVRQTSQQPVGALPTSRQTPAPQRGTAADFALATLVYVGFGAFRSLFRNRPKPKLPRRN
jgi:membrane protein